MESFTGRGPGCSCVAIREGYHPYSIGSHLLFYVEQTNSVDIVRVVHQRVDPSRHLEVLCLGRKRNP
jgi:toxin ParE1/3/4